MNRYRRKGNLGKKAYYLAKRLRKEVQGELKFIDTEVD